MKSNINTSEGFASVQTFNELAGNLANVTDVSVDAQISFIFEELTETIDGMETLNRVEILDGACDLFVTVAGLMLKLEAQGYNVAEALQRVNENNLTKFPVNGATFTTDPAHVATLNPEYDRWVIKDANGKVRKPLEFVSVDLTDLVPAGGN